MESSVMLDRLNDLLRDDFKQRIKDHIKTNFFPFLYCNFQSKINNFNVEDKKKVIIENIKGLNMLYQTRISNNSIEPLKEKLNDADWNNYKATIKKFEGSNITKNGDRNAFSLGTKILHTYNPEENPIVDKNVRKELGNFNMTIENCICFKDAVKSFIENENIDDIREEVRDYFNDNYLNIDNFSDIKLIDMAILK